MAGSVISQHFLDTFQFRLAESKEKLLSDTLVYLQANEAIPPMSMCVVDFDFREYIFLYAEQQGKAERAPCIYPAYVIKKK